MSETQERPMAEEFAVYDSMTLIQLAGAMNTLRERKEELEERLKRVNAHYDFVRMTKIPAKMEEDGVESTTISGIGRLQLAADMYVGIVADKKAEAYQWLADTGRESLIQPSVNPSTLKAAIKEAFRRGEEIPEEYFRVSPFTRASIVKAGVVKKTQQ